jgi:hypothetical protein
MSGITPVSKGNDLEGADKPIATLEVECLFQLDKLIYKRID